MQLARLLSSALVLAGLAGAIWWSNKQDAKDTPAEAIEPGAPKALKKKDATPSIISITERDVKGLEVEHAGEPTVVVASDAPGSWRISAPQVVTADVRTLIGIIAAATNLPSERVIDDKLGADENALKGYGLNPPLTAIKFLMKNGSTKRLRVGEDTPDGVGAYASVDGDGRLFTMLASQKALFDKHLGDLREKHLLQVKPDQLTKIELNVPGKPAVELGKTTDHWQMVKPVAARIDATQVDELIRKLNEAQMQTDAPQPESTGRGKARPATPAVFDEQKSATAFAGAHPVAVATLTTAQGVMSLEVRKAGMDYFARASGLNSTPGTFKVSAELGDGLDKTAADFRNKKLFDFGFNDPSRIEYSYMGQTRVFEKNGETWTADAREMDPLAMQNFVDKLRDLAASRLEDGRAPAAGKAGTAMEITITSKPPAPTSAKGKADSAKAAPTPHVEKISISPMGKDFAGRRDSEATAYILDQTTITGLSEAANGVRENQSKGKK